METIILSTQHTNKHGEVMNLKLDIYGKTWFNHEDCNGQEYQDIETLYKDINIGPKILRDRFIYVLSNDEAAVLNSFLIASKEICEELDNYQKCWGLKEIN